MLDHSRDRNSSYYRRQKKKFFITPCNDLNNKRLAERKNLIKIMECIRFLARQGLAFRRNDGNDNLN